MTDLLTSLREATEPSRELDARIHAWVNGWEHEGMWQTCMPPKAGFVHDGKAVWIIPPAYTSNLQDALELVPADSDGFLSCGIYLDEGRCDAFVNCHPQTSASEDRPNAALALACAAIEARMKLEEEA